MKILLINGSHRKGNTQFMLETMRNQIHNINPKHIPTLINLRQKNIEFCSQKDYNCSITKDCSSCCRDDMQDIYPLMEQANVIVMGSPVYFSNVSARMKNFMDRCNPFYFSGKLKGKYVVLVGVGQTMDNKEFISSLRAFSQTMGMQVADIFYETGQQHDSVEKNQKVIKQLKQFTKQFLVSSSKAYEMSKI